MDTRASVAVRRRWNSLPNRRLAPEVRLGQPLHPGLDSEEAAGLRLRPLPTGIVRLIVRLMGTLVAEITPRIFAVCSEGQDGADSADGCGVTLISRLLQQGGHVAQRPCAAEFLPFRPSATLRLLKRKNRLWTGESRRQTIANCRRGVWRRGVVILNPRSALTPFFSSALLPALFV